ncbi:ubiquitin carboxyl-terminal hydrolase isozyme L3 isoform X2 [Procambarus clarkii]|uniref:ubiquitin carboxyl-terminal hydrolase isozyme L3 isoform X2 n=1 Tax=Procambarus clarkii TaxID=6728 RepID=UPI00374384BD
MVRWLPLESNPAFLAELGVPASWTIHDVYGLEDELLSMVPQPVGAVILLYPFNEKGKEFMTKNDEELEAEGQEVPEKVYFMKQFVGNACGTVALIHAIANNVDKIELGDGALKDFLEKTTSLSPEERGHALESDEGISKAHDESAQEGQTEAPERDAVVNEHFIAMVEVDGNLYELDGRRKFPVNHGPTSADTLLQDAAKVCRQFMDRDPEESRFAIVALTGSD